MRYETGQAIEVGDAVIADGMAGIVVCDFDTRTFLEGYGDWDAPDVAMLGGGFLSSGVMIKTTQAGLIHYEHGLGRIEFLRRRGS